MPSGDNIGGIYAQLDLDASQMATALADAETRTRTAEKAIKDLIADLNAGKVASAQFGAEFAKLTAQFQQAQQQASGLKAAMNGATGSSGAMQQRIQALGYAFQDFTATSGDLGQKLNSITNNLPMLFAGMGGLGQAIAAAGTAATVLYRNWDSLMDSIGAGKVKTEAQEMEALASATKRTADETERLRVYKEREAATEKAKKSLPEKEEERRKDATKPIEDAGGETVLKGLVDSYHKDKSNAKMTDEEAKEVGALRKKYEELRAELGDDDEYVKNFRMGLDKEEEKINERLRKEDRERAEKTLGKALTDPEAFKALRNRVEKSPELFPPGFLKELEDARPEEKKKQAALEAEREQQGLRMERERKRDHDLADQLGGGDAGRKALEGSATEKDVEDALRKSGVKDADKKARGAWAALTTEAERKIQQRATERGIGRDEARKQLLEEHDERDPETTKLERPLAAGDIGRKALEGKLELWETVKALKDQGVDPAKAEEKAEQVRARLMKDSQEAIRQRMAEKGITEAKAREELLAERDDKEAEIAKRAAPLAKGALGRKAVVQTVTASDVSAALEAAGETPEDAAKHAQKIAEKLNRDADAEVKKKALDEGLSEEKARARLAREKGEEGENKALEKAKKKAPPGLVDDTADEATLAIRLGQTTAKQAHDFFVKRFKQQGLSDAEAEDATAGLGRESRKRVDQRIYEEQQNFKPTHSETFDASSIKDRVQAGVSNEKVLNNIRDLQQRQVEYLAKIANRAGVDPYGVY